jgi:hypothetical protein
MKDCWQVLGVPATTDVEVVKRAYRALIKRYHPDTIASQSPEMIQLYTTKCGRINQAFKQAIEWCASDAHADLGSGGVREAGKRWGEAVRQGWVWRPSEHPPTEGPRCAEVRNRGPVSTAVTYLAPLLVMGSPILILCLANMLRQMASLLAGR